MTALTETRAALRLAPISLRDANTLVTRLHRHHGRDQGHKFAIACLSGDQIVGAAITGRPRAKGLQDGTTAEVTRLVTDGTPHACSMLYGAAWRCWKAMGGLRICTYILATEPGTSLKAAGWEFCHHVPATQGWAREGRKSRDVPQPAKLMWGCHKRCFEVLP